MNFERLNGNKLKMSKPRTRWPRTMPGYIDGGLLHVAVAIQSGNLFTNPKELYDFACGSFKANLRNLSKAQRRQLVGLEQFDSDADRIGFHKGSLFKFQPLDVAYFLGAEFKPLDNVGQAIAETTSTKSIGTIAFPFYIGSGLFVTIHDLDAEGRFIFKEAPIQFGDFYVTKQALLSGAYWAHVLEPHTATLLHEGAELRAASEIDRKLAWSFSERVCVWGGRAGVAVKLKRRAQENRAIEKQFSM